MHTVGIGLCEVPSPSDYSDVAGPLPPAPGVPPRAGGDKHALCGGCAWCGVLVRVRMGDCEGVEVIVRVCILSLCELSVVCSTRPHWTLLPSCPAIPAVALPQPLVHPTADGGLPGCKWMGSGCQWNVVSKKMAGAPPHQGPGRLSAACQVSSRSTRPAWCTVELCGAR